MTTKRVPPEIWIQIFRFATTISTSETVSLSSPFDLRRQEAARSFEEDYAQSLGSKTSISLVSKRWRYFVFPFLWEVLCLLPGRRHHAIGSTLQRYSTITTSHPQVDDRSAGEFVRALHILEPENGAVHELYDMANIQRIIICCPNLVTLTAPDKWQLYSRDFHLSFQSDANLREVHLAAVDEETIQSIFQFPERLLVVHGSNFEFDDAAVHRKIILPNAHTISMRLSDMDDRNIFAPSLSHWIIHDSVLGINSSRVYQRHAALVISLELPCSWCDRATLQTALAGMSQLQELAVHLDPLCLSPVPCCLPRTLRRLGFFCPYPKQGWVLDTDAGTFQWFLDHLDDWLAVAIRTQETLDLVRFLDWEEVRLPKASLMHRKVAYMTWWTDQLALCGRVGLKLQNQLGKPLTIESEAACYRDDSLNSITL